MISQNLTKIRTKKVF